MQRLLEHVEIEDRGYSTPCWVWTGSVTKDGYGRIEAVRRYQARRNSPA